MFSIKGLTMEKLKLENLQKTENLFGAQWQPGTINTNQKKRFLNPKRSFVDQKCFEWFVHARSLHSPISGSIIKVK